MAPVINPVTSSGLDAAMRLSATLRPRRITTTRSHTVNTSGMRWLISITAVPFFVKVGARVEQVTVADYAAHIDYAVNRIGLAHVGIGADFEGGGGVTGWRSAADTPALTAELTRRGYGPAQLAALWGGNFLRLLRQAEAVAAGGVLPVPAAL